MIAPEYLEIEILEDWMGNPPHSIMNLLKDKAIQLVERGAAKYIEDKPADPVHIKQVEKPPMNKMIKKSPAKKAGRPKK